MPLKVAFIGAGSGGFTRGLVRDILCVPEKRVRRLRAGIGAFKSERRFKKVH